MKTIGQYLKVKDFPFQVITENGNEIYVEHPNGQWEKLKYDSNGEIIYSENSGGYWEKWKYDSDRNEIYYENSEGVIVDKPDQV